MLEASLAGRKGVGTDNNAVAILASQAKTAIYSNDDLNVLKLFATRIASGLEFAILRPDLIPTNKNFHYWFNPLTVQRLAALKGLILAEQESIRPLLLAVFSSIIVRVSYQDSDTRYARKIRKVPIDEVDKLFRSRLLDRTARIPDVMVKERGSTKVIQADARSVPFIKSGSVSLIVTSPPYLNAYDYHKYHRQRLHWIGGEESVEFARDREIGSHDEFTKNKATPDGYFSDMSAFCLNGHVFSRRVVTV